MQRVYFIYLKGLYPCMSSPVRISHPCIAGTFVGECVALSSSIFSDEHLSEPVRMMCICWYACIHKTFVLCVSSHPPSHTDIDIGTHMNIQCRCTHTHVHAHAHPPFSAANCAVASRSFRCASDLAAASLSARSFASLTCSSASRNLCSSASRAAACPVYHRNGDT